MRGHSRLLGLLIPLPPQTFILAICPPMPIGGFDRDFGFMWWSQVLSQVAEGVSKLALLWFVYAVTGSPLKTTVIGLPDPPILFGPFIGVPSIVFPRKAILIVSDVARGLLIGLIPLPGID